VLRLHPTQSICTSESESKPLATPPCNFGRSKNRGKAEMPKSRHRAKSPKIWSCWKTLDTTPDSGGTDGSIGTLTLVDDQLSYAFELPALLHRAPGAAGLNKMLSPNCLSISSSSPHATGLAKIPRKPSGDSPPDGQPPLRHSYEASQKLRGELRAGRQVGLIPPDKHSDSNCGTWPPSPCNLQGVPREVLAPNFQAPRSLPIPTPG